MGWDSSLAERLRGALLEIASCSTKHFVLTLLRGVAVPLPVLFTDAGDPPGCPPPLASLHPDPLSPELSEHVLSTRRW